MKQPKGHTRPGSHGLQVRLFWPILLLALVLPFISWHMAPRVEAESTSGDEVKPGPWGTLECVDIDIELPEHFIDVDHTDPAEWIFQGATREAALEIFDGAYLTEAQLKTLSRDVIWEQTSEGVVVRPPDDLLWSLSPTSRAHIYSVLAACPENVNQFFAFNYRPARLPKRLLGSDLNDETIAMFKQLLYPQGSLVRFADVDIVLRKIADKNERLNFVKMLTRRSTLLVKLKVTPETSIDDLIAYWGAGGRAKDLRPLLESLTKVPGGCKIDIAHLMPPLPRQKIYTFPYPTADQEQRPEDCHWTALNFFEVQPAYYNSPEEIAATISTTCTLIGSDLSRAQFGDLIFLKTEDDILVHSAVYIAEQIVYTKNGAGMNQPWLYMKMDDMLAYYEMPGHNLRVEIYRRKQI